MVMGEWLMGTYGVVMVGVIVIGTYYEGSDHHHCCREGDGSGTKVLSLSIIIIVLL